MAAFYNMTDISAFNATILYPSHNLDPVGQRQRNRLRKMLLIKLGKELASIEGTKECNTTPAYAKKNNCQNQLQKRGDARFAHA